MNYRIGYGLAAFFWLSLCLYNIMNPKPFIPTGNANVDTGNLAGGWLFPGFIVYAVLHCAWRAIRGPRVVDDSIGINAVPQSLEIENESPPRSVPIESSVIQASEGSDRDSEIIRYILENDRKPPPDRIYFLTLTPRNEWGDTGTWQDFPSPLLEAIPSIAGEYRPAHGAILKDNRVIEKETDKDAWMKWITITRWHSDSEVEVEQGVWSCPSNGGASTAIYEKQGGKWAFKSLTSSWVA